MGDALDDEFLSCLRGSEQLEAVHLPHQYFLSCLRGSERA